MNWTNEKPTKPGWYWWRENKVKGYERTHIIHVFGTALNGLAIISGWSGMLDETVKEFGGQFAGPIPEPSSKSETVHCLKCNWRGHESELIEKMLPGEHDPVLMPEDTCPNCGSVAYEHA
jgi:hypothetical protein